MSDKCPKCGYSDNKDPFTFEWKWSKNIETGDGYQVCRKCKAEFK